MARNPLISGQGVPVPDSPNSLTTGHVARSCKDVHPIEKQETMV
ncbi:MAG TPA: hypothetical protein VMT44_05930 [Methanoregula sp.]|nr:hypothetical protein [Methanoregula sp.]